MRNGGEILATKLSQGFFFRRARFVSNIDYVPLTLCQVGLNDVSHIGVFGCSTHIYKVRIWPHANELPPTYVKKGVATSMAVFFPRDPQKARIWFGVFLRQRWHVMIKKKGLEIFEVKEIIVIGDIETAQ